ncbi:MAG: glycosyltransferase family 2 protein [Rhodocyclaceae bacterium]|nr:glycosyltransferase family 2 protein [Rhodocyclaceae bacterium]
MPAYNHAAYIEACLASVCAQTYPELELVLIDDGSQDDTLEAARRFPRDRAAGASAASCCSARTIRA